MVEKIRLEDRECPLSATLGLVGEWWTLLILHDAFDGYTRFDQFQANLGISSSLLTSRLKRLVDNGLLERRQYQERPPRHEYVLTELGRSLRPVIVVLAAWGNARLAPNDRSMILVDSVTGGEADPVVVDRQSGRPVDGADFVFTAGPAASAPFRDRYHDRPGPHSHPDSRRERILSAFDAFLVARLPASATSIRTHPASSAECCTPLRPTFPGIALFVPTARSPRANHSAACSQPRAYG